VNLYDGVVPREDEHFATLHEREGLRIVRILSGEVETPKEFCDEWDEWVVLLRGRARLEMEGREYALKAGESLFIPAHTPHTLLFVESGSLWLAVHYDPRRCG